MSVPLSEPLSLKQLLDQSLRQLQQHWRSVLLPFGVPLALTGGIMPILQLVIAQPQFTGSPEQAFAQLGRTLILTGVWMVFYWFASAALMVAATDAVVGRPLSPLRAWGKVLRPRWFATLGLVWSACFGATLCCVLPGIYVGLILGVVVPVMNEQSRFGLAAMRRSASLMRQNPGRKLQSHPMFQLLMVFVVGLAVSYAISFLVALPASGYMVYRMVRDVMAGIPPNPQVLTREMVWVQVPTGMVSGLAQTLALLYISCGTALLYVDVTVRRQGKDLLDASAALARGETGGP